jgi:hypothetical protein
MRDLYSDCGGYSGSGISSTCANSNSGAAVVDAERKEKMFSRTYHMVQAASLFFIVSAPFTDQTTYFFRTKTRPDASSASNIEEAQH